MPVVPGDFGATPPEVNYYTLIAGDHAASCEAAAVAYQTLSDAVTGEMAVMASNTTMTAAQGWKGLGGSAMLMTAGTFEGVLGAAWGGWMRRSGRPPTSRRAITPPRPG